MGATPSAFLLDRISLSEELRATANCRSEKPNFFARENVFNLDRDPESILTLYKALIALRKRLPQLVTGAYQPVAAQGDILLYRREGKGNGLVVALNFSGAPVSIASSSIGFGRVILLSTFLDRQGEEVQGTLDLRGNEGVILGPSAQAG